MKETRLPGYTVLGRLGEGGMGVVYRAREDATGREVAVKLLPRRLAGDEMAQGLFLREAILGSTLDHPNITRLLGSGEAEDGRFFFASELLRGKSVQALLQRELPSIDRALDIAAQTASGLAVAHDRRVVHRDIKPSNLMLVEGGRVKILDFGLARFDAASGEGLGGKELGTLHYCSPEQVRGEDADGRSDLWSLGVVLYELLTGELPFTGSDRRQTLEYVLEREPLPASAHRPNAPRRLDEIVSCMLAKDREERYPTGRGLSLELDELRRELPPEEPRVDPPAGGHRGKDGLLARLWRGLVD